MGDMTTNARLAELDREKSALMAQIAKAQRAGQTDPALLSKIRQLSRERVDIVAA